MTLVFPQLLLHRASEKRVAIREKKYGIWQMWSWQKLAFDVASLAFRLKELGVAKEHKVILVSANRYSMYVSMLAAQVLRAIPVPLYQDAVATEYIYPLQITQCTLCIVEDQEQVDKMLEIRSECPLLKYILYDDPLGLRNYQQEGLRHLQQLLSPLNWTQQEAVAWLEDTIKPNVSEDVAAIFFTSGTTGNPKGVVHTHQSLLDRARAGANFDKLTEKEEVLAYLPPAWIGQNIFSYAQWMYCGYTINCPESTSTVSNDRKEIGPTYFFAPPRIFEDMLTNVMIRMEDASTIKHRVFHYFMNLAKKCHPMVSATPTTLWQKVGLALGDILVYGALRNNLGLSRVRVAYTAGEAIGPDLFTFFRSIGVNLKQLYGSTETAVFVCMQPDHQVKSDTVGVPCDGVEIQVSPSGEVLIRSAGLLREYFQNPSATREVLDAEGWYHSNDAGFIDHQGHLKIIDRIKDVGKISGGHYDQAMFAPKYVENKLKFFPFIKEAVAFGDSREYVCALLNIDMLAVGNWAERRNLPYAGYTDLAQKSEVYVLMQECVESVNRDLAQDPMLAGSQISRFLVLHKELDADDGEITRTNKVKRGFIAEKYKVLVDALYSEDIQEQFIETAVKFEDGRSGSISATLKLANAQRF
ncbi:MAG: AMP-binding protein [Gammaproteobacteria bacterium]|nr:AMP-binding protein [Gammaproteobacteria bacterium]